MPRIRYDSTESHSAEAETTLMIDHAHWQSAWPRPGADFSFLSEASEDALSVAAPRRVFLPSGESPAEQQHGGDFCPSISSGSAKLIDVRVESAYMHFRRRSLYLSRKIYITVKFFYLHIPA